MAGSSAVTSATTKLYISPNLPASFDQTGYTAVSGWILIAEVSNMGTFGAKAGTVKHVPIDTAVVVKRATSVDAGTLSVTLARHAGADITALQTAANNRTSQSFKVVYPAALGVSDYFTGIVLGTPTTVGTADQILQMNVDIELDSIPVTF
jgi:hypothetical protein